MNKISNPSAGTTIVSTVKPHEGGTGQTTANLAANAISALKNNQINAAGGVAGSDELGRLKSSQVPFENLSSVSLQGPTSVMKGVETTYTIRNFDTFTEYVAQATKGTVSITNDIVTYTAPIETGPAGFTINGREFVVTVKDFAPVTPLITSPVAAASLVETAYTFTSNAFNVPDGQSIHASSDWQIATDAQFANIAFDSINSSINKLNWTVNGLVDQTSYFVRVRYKGSTGTYSDWSNPVVFSVAVPVPVKPTITSNANNSTVYQATATTVSSTYSIQGDVSAHASTDWQLSSSSDFSSLVSSATNDVNNKTSWNIAGLVDGSSYYLRLRHKAANGKVSPWSDTVRINVIFAFVVNPVISAGVNNYNMRAAAIAAGWDQVLPLKMTVTVNSGVVIGSTSSGSPAFQTGAGFPAQSTLSLVNSGSIVGAGGGGGTGYISGASAAGGGGGGGTGLVANAPLSVNNLSTIAGGGGGGGGGGGTYYFSNNNNSRISGGNGGSGAGAANGNVYGATGGGLGGDDGGSSYATFAGGSGGSLGNPGSSGSTGSAGGVNGDPAGGGGGGGLAVQGNSNITWTNTGIRLGSVV